jgi:hypothetical protein
MSVAEQRSDGSGSSASHHGHDRMRHLWTPATIVCALLLLLPTLAYPLDHDQGVFMYLGRTILAGKMPYLDAWDNKPPLIHLLYAAVAWPDDFDTARRLLHAVDVLAQIVGSFSVAVVARACLADCGRLGREVGAFAGGAWNAALYVSQGSFQIAQAESFAGAALVAGAAVLLGVAHQPGRRRWLSACVLFGVALAFKPTVVIAIPILIWPVVRGARAVYLAMGAVASLAPCLALAVWLVVGGGMSSCVELLWSYLPFYATLGHGVVRRSLHIWLRLYLGPLLLAGVGLLYSACRQQSVLHTRCIAFAILGIVGMFVVQGKGLWYHLSPALPLVSILVGVAIGGLVANVPRGLVPRVLALACLCGAPAFYVVWYRGSGYSSAVSRLWCEVRDHAGASCVSAREESEQRASDRISAVMQPGDDVLVWGRPITIYQRVRATAPTRFFSNIPIVSEVCPAAWRREFARKVLQEPPKAVVVAKDDAAPGVTGTAMPSSSLLNVIPGLAEALGRSYHLQYDDDFLTVYVRP